jgi:hypothetical protein
LAVALPKGAADVIQQQYGSAARVLHVSHS